MNCDYERDAQLAEALLHKNNPVVKLQFGVILKQGWLMSDPHKSTQILYLSVDENLLCCCSGMSCL